MRIFESSVTQKVLFWVTITLPTVRISINLPEQFTDSDFQLLVPPVHGILRPVPYDEIRLELRIFQIMPVTSTVAYDRDTEIHRRILQGLPVHDGSCRVSQFTEVIVPGTGMPTIEPRPWCW